MVIGFLVTFLNNVLLAQSSPEFSWRASSRKSPGASRISCDDDSPAPGNIKSFRDHLKPCLLQYHATIWSWRSIKSSYVLFIINDAFTVPPRAHTKVTNILPCHHKNRLLYIGLVTIWIIIFLLNLEDTTAMTSKNHLNVLCQSISDELGPKVISYFSGYSEHMALTLHNRVLLALVDAMTNCVYWQLFSEVFLSSCNNIYDTIMLVFNAVSPKSLKVMGMQWWFLALMLRLIQISPCPSYTPLITKTHTL